MRKKIQPKLLKINLPFKLGEIEFENDTISQTAAWDLYVELSTRVSVVPLNNSGILRESINSLYEIFIFTRKILHQYGPKIAYGNNSLASIAIKVLNDGIRPFLVKWHPKLKDYEEKKPIDISSIEHEKNWQDNQLFRQELLLVQEQLLVYISTLETIIGLKK